jgi:Rrf2 family protein
MAGFYPVGRSLRGTVRPMLWSSACDYAIRAAAHLAERPGELIQLRDIARDESIPAPFVGKILQALVRSDVLRSVRGPRGGYALAHPAHEITLLMIRAAIDGTRDLDQCVVGLGTCSTDVLCPLHDAFAPVRAAIRGYLETTTLAEMAAARAGKRARARVRERPASRRLTR